MGMKKCQVCQEQYSDTYKSCPFCEEDEALHAGEKIRRYPKRGQQSIRGIQYNLVTPTLIVLILIMLSLLVYLLYGDKLAEKFMLDDFKFPLFFTEEVVPPVSDEDGDEDVEQTPPDPDTEGTEGTDASQMPSVEVEPEEISLDYEAASQLPDGLQLSTYDFSLLALGKTHTVKVTSGSGTYTWMSEDEGIATVDNDGKVTAVSGGTVNVIVTDGSKKAVCIVRVRDRSNQTSTPNTPTTNQISNQSGNSSTVKLNREDVTISIGENCRLKLSGVDETLIWSTSNPAVVSVVGDGTVTGVSKGNATVTVSWSGGTKSCIVRVSG